MNYLAPCTMKELQSLYSNRACITQLPPTMGITVQVYVLLLSYPRLGFRMVIFLPLFMCHIDFYCQDLNHPAIEMTTIGFLVRMVKKYCTRYVISFFSSMIILFVVFLNKYFFFSRVCKLKLCHVYIIRLAMDMHKTLTFLVLC